jgi:iron complex outermembrane receptor protein
MSTLRKTKFSRAGLMAAASILACPVAGEAWAQSAERGSTVDELVITARKREEAVQDVPVSVYAESGEALAKQGITDAAQLAGVVPGIALQDGGPGYRTVFIRGMGSDRGNAPTTSFYLDESFVPPGGIVQTIVEPLFFDVDRVEVLRGPQGTVFGGSSMGGTVRVISKAPNPSAFDWAVGGDVSSTTDGGLNEQISGMVNLVLAPDKAALRISGSYRHHDGFIDQIVAPGGFAGAKRTPVGPTTIYEDINDDTTLTARIALSLALTDRLTVTPSVFYQRTEAGAFGAYDRPAGERDVRRRVRADENITDEFTLGNLLVNYDAGPVQITSSTSYSRRPAGYREDISDFIYTRYFGGLMATPIQFPYDATSRESLLTQEFRLTSSGESRFNYVLGAYYDDYKRGSHTIVEVDPTTLVSAFLPAFQALAAGLYPTGVVFERASGFERKQFALFGEADYDLTSKLNFAVGVRYYKFNMDSEVILPTYQQVKNEEDGYNPRVTLSYKATDEHLLYLTASKGFRPGGPNRVFDAIERAACGAQYAAAGVSIDPATGLVEPYGPDSVWNYEAGAKTDWMGGRLRLNSAVYAMNWDDIQQTFLPACGRAVTQNFGKAEIRGVELEWNAQLTGQLSFFGGVNYNNAEISEDITALGVLAGTKVQNSPEWSGNANVQYDFSGPFGTDATALFNVRYVDESFRDFAQTAVSARRFQDAYTQVNIRMNFAKDGWSWGLYANNLTDENPGVMNFLSSGGPVTSHERMFTLQPRTIGISLRIDR